MLKNRFFNITVVCLSISMGLAACQGSRAKKETLSYQFSNDSCTTGKKTFSDLTSYCSGLQDDATNNNCAAEMRLEAYNKKCSEIATKTSSEVEKENEKQASLDESMSYDFSANGCSTGKKIFPDLASYCTGLKDDEANNHCAPQLRVDAFKQNCMFDLKSLSEAEKSEEKNESVTRPQPESQVNATSAAAEVATETK